MSGVNDGPKGQLTLAEKLGYAMAPGNEAKLFLALVDQGGGVPADQPGARGLSQT